MSLKDVIQDNLTDPQILSIIKNSIFEESKSQFSNLDDEKKLEKSKQYFEKICNTLKEYDLLNNKSMGIVMEALNKAITADDEEYLYKIMHERDRLKVSMKYQKQQIKTLMVVNCKNMENFIYSSEFENKDEISLVLKDRLLNDLEMLGILKETAESAFLTTIEMGDDVQDTAYEIAKNMTYLAINEGELTKKHFIQIAKAIILVAINIANESKMYAKELVCGAIDGTKDGISKAIEKFKDELEFTPDEMGESLGYNPKEFIKIEDDFISLLKQAAISCNEPSKTIINEALQNDYNRYFSRLKRISGEAREKIIEKIENLSQKSSIFKSNLYINEKFGNFEKIASEKLAQIKKIQTFENAKTEAKKFGDRIYEAAKKFIESTKKKP